MNMNELIRQVTEANRMLPQERLAILTWGNVSGISEDRARIAIKASGIDYAGMTEGDITITDCEGRVLSGGTPSTDLPTHLAIYRAFPSAGAVVHIHSTYATMWAQAGKAIPEIPCTRELTAEEIGTPADRDYEKNTGAVIAETFERRDPEKVPAVLVRKHGPFVWGPSPKDAVKNAMVLEYIAKMAYLQRTMAYRKPEGIRRVLLDKHYYRKFGENAYYGQKKK